jgi:hypothetical protein
VKLRLCFNAILLLAVILCLATVGLRVFEQLQFQLTDPRGGDSMWPMTFMGFAVLASVLSPFAGCSVLFNHDRMALLRGSAITAIVFLLGMWVYSSVLLLRDYESLTGPSRYSYPTISISRVFGNMIGFDGGPFMAVSLVLFAVAAIVGRGPVSLLADRLRKRGK